MNVSISGLNKAEVLVALYNHSRSQGLGVFMDGGQAMSPEAASQLLKGRSRFDYVGGRVLKVDLSGDDFDPYLYDRDNGNGAAQRVINNLRKE